MISFNQLPKPTCFGDLHVLYFCPNMDLGNFWMYCLFPSIWFNLYSNVLTFLSVKHLSLSCTSHHNAPVPQTGLRMQFSPHGKQNGCVICAPHPENPPKCFLQLHASISCFSPKLFCPLGLVKSSFAARPKIWRPTPFKLQSLLSSCKHGSLTLQALLTLLLWRTKHLNNLFSSPITLHNFSISLAHGCAFLHLVEMAGGPPVFSHSSVQPSSEQTRTKPKHCPCNSFSHSSGYG